VSDEDRILIKTSFEETREKSEMSGNKHLQHLQNLVQELASDYEINRTKSGHFAVEMRISGSTKTIFAPGTPSDHRSMMNVRTKLRRAANMMSAA
jgi:hypothetical protein